MKTINTNTLLIIIAVLIAGFGVGYLVRGSSAPSLGGHMMSNGTSMNNHMMSDGNMMADHMMGGNTMTSAMDGMMANLEGKKGAEFDKAFLSEMIVHHQGAVKMAASVLKNSERPELIQLANDIISAQEKEIRMMKDWKETWFNQ
jgi:uncharacterized protein (DUF305 family)